VGAELAVPKGGFYVFPNFTAPRTRLAERGIDSSRELCERALDELGVAVLPGSVFGRPAHELSVRISCVDFDGGVALDAAGELGVDEDPDEDFLQKYCNPTFDAINRLADWVADS
jgi:aspartate aminotransferase